MIHISIISICEYIMYECVIYIFDTKLPYNNMRRYLTKHK